jgi:hypothetical protein
MSYSISVNSDSIVVNSETIDYKVDSKTNEYSVSLSRAGGQGSKGDSVTNVYIDSNKDLIFEISNSLGTVVETVNAGSFKELINLVDLLDVDYNLISDNDVIQYDSATNKFTSHTLTTTSISDIDNTNKTDGAVLLYDGNSKKYKATTNLDNSNTVIIGGTF